ncbi:MAG: hypothetical protein U0167_14340 [bacterium]
MRRFARGLLAIVPLLILLQATATPVPRCMAVQLTAHAAQRCRHAVEHSCPLAEAAGSSAAACHAEGSCRAQGSYHAQGSCHAQGACHAQGSCRTVASCRAEGRGCPFGEAFPCSRGAASPDTPVLCCMMCPFWIGLVATAPALPSILPAAPPSFPPAQTLQSIDLDPLTPPPELPMSC